MNVPEVEIVRLTPDFAKELLSANTDNYRHVNRDHVSRLAAAMRRGEFDPVMPSNDAVVLSDGGVLQNGQHRCLAVVASEVDIPVLLIRGAPPSAKDTIDTGGLTRTAGAVLAHHGFTDASSIAAGVRSYHVIRAGTRSIRLTTPQILGFASQHGAMMYDSVLVARRVERGGARMARGFAAGLHFAFAQADRSNADYFFDRLVDGEGLYRGNAIYALRNWLIARRGEKGSVGIDRIYLAAISIKAWNAWRNAQEVTVLKWRAKGAHAEPYPSIDGLDDGGASA